MGSTIPQIHRIHLLFSYQQLQKCKWFFELKIISTLFLINPNPNRKLKKLINEQIIIFYSSSSALCSSDPQTEHFKHFKHSKHIILLYLIQVTRSTFCGIVFQTMYVSKMCIALKEILKNSVYISVRNLANL